MPDPSGPSKKRKPDRDDANRAFKERVKSELAGNPLWQVKTTSGYWICPWCGVMGAHWNPKKSSEMVAEIMGHFAYRCKSFNRGRGEPMALEKVQEHARLSDLARRIRKHPEWNVRDDANHWYCPLNGARTNIVLENEPPTLSDLRMVQHYLDHAPDIDQKADPLNVDQMQISVRLWTDPHYRCYDAMGRWYNPFRLRPTEIRLDPTRRITRAQVEAVTRLIHNSIEYVTHRGNPPEPVEHVLDAVRVGQKKAMLARELRFAVANHPVWSVVGEYGHWVCPFCREEQSGVDVSSLFLLKRVGPRQMARHLVDECQGFTTRREPATSVDELGGTSMLSGQSAGGRHDYEMAARAFESLQQPSDEDVAQVTGRIMAVRPTPEEAEAHRAVQEHHVQVMERARQVQLGMLPKTPNVPGFEIGTFYMACEDVGGDFYDFVPVSPHEWGLVMGDVSGHGIHAALVMAAAKKSIQIHGKGKSSPHETMCVVNDDLRPELPPNIFVTIFYGVLNLQKMQLTWVRAGHNPLVLYNTDRPQTLQEFKPNGMIVGMAPSAMVGKVLQEHVIDLLPGDVIFQYTDGVTEAMDVENNEYGEDRMREVINSVGNVPLDELIQRMHEDVEEFRRGAEPNDDVTMLALRYTGEVGDGMGDEAEALPASARFNAVHASVMSSAENAIPADEEILDATPASERKPAITGSKPSGALPGRIGPPPKTPGDRRPSSSIISLDFDEAGQGGSSDELDAVPLTPTPLSAEELATLSGLMVAPMDFAADAVPAPADDSTDG